MPDRIAYIPLNTHPDSPSEDATLAAVNLARRLGFGMHIATFAVEIPPMASPLGGFMIEVEGLARRIEERSKADCDRLRALIEAQDQKAILFTHHQPVMGAAPETAAIESRYFDLVLLPWSAGSAQDMAQALVFGSGLPVVLVPESTKISRVDHIAIAWDESRVAARAMGDALRLLAEGGRITVLTVQDEKALSGAGVAETLVASLELRGYEARAVNLRLEGQPIAQVLQDAAIRAEAQILAMGGFGHSRLRDFVLGGATKAVLADLRMATLLSH